MYMYTDIMPTATNNRSNITKAIHFSVYEKRCGAEAERLERVLHIIVFIGHLYHAVSPCRHVATSTIGTHSM